MGFPKEPNSSTHCEEDLSVEVNGDVVHADQGCHGIVLWPWDVNFSMPSKKHQEKNSCHKLEIQIQAIHGEVPEYALLAVHGGLQCEFFCMIFPFYI